MLKKLKCSWTAIVAALVLAQLVLSLGEQGTSDDDDSQQANTSPSTDSGIGGTTGSDTSSTSSSNQPPSDTTIPAKVDPHAGNSPGGSNSDSTNPSASTGPGVPPVSAVRKDCSVDVKQSILDTTNSALRTLRIRRYSATVTIPKVDAEKVEIQCDEAGNFASLKTKPNAILATAKGEYTGKCGTYYNKDHPDKAFHWSDTFYAYQDKFQADAQLSFSFSFANGDVICDESTASKPSLRKTSCGNRPFTEQMQFWIRDELAFEVRYAIGDALKKKFTPCDKGLSSTIGVFLKKKLQGDSKSQKESFLNGNQIKTTITLDKNFNEKIDVDLSCNKGNKLSHMRVYGGLSYTMVEDFRSPELCATLAVDPIKQITVTSKVQLDYVNKNTKAVDEETTRALNFDWKYTRKPKNMFKCKEKNSYIFVKDTAAAFLKAFEDKTKMEQFVDGLCK